MSSRYGEFHDALSDDLYKTPAASPVIIQNMLQHIKALEEVNALLLPIIGAFLIANDPTLKLTRDEFHKGERSLREMRRALPKEIKTRCLEAYQKESLG